MFLYNKVLSEQNDFEKQKHSKDYVRDENFKNILTSRTKKSNSNVTYSTTEYAKKCQPSGIVEPHLLSEREPAFFFFFEFNN